jgi:hypothetical protein
VGYFESEGEGETSRLIHELALGANIRGTRRLTLDGNAGISIINPRQSGAATVGGSSGSDVSVGFVGDLSLTYTPWADTIMTVAVSQDISPDALGDLRTLRVARGSASYQINERSSLNVLGAFTTSTPSGEDEDSRQAWTLSPTYNYEITRDWSLALSYQWTKTDAAVSNSAFLTLSHNGAILP